MLNDWLTVKVIHNNRVNEAPKKQHRTARQPVKSIRRRVLGIASLLG